MKATIYISGKIGKDTTLVDVIRQFKSYEDPTEVLAVIDSIGGSKEEGDSIYNYLDGLKSEMPVNTYAKKAYSISAKIFTVGQERTVDDVDKALMIHFAWAKVEGDAEKLELIAEELREMENEFTAFYSELLSIDQDTVRDLLENETFVSGSEAVDLSFATELKVVAEAVAEYNSNIDSKLNTKEMTDKKVKKNAGQKLLEAMAAFIGVDINAELTLQDSNATDIVFPDIESDATPKVGDKATIDGSAIPDGSHIMPSLEDSTLVFVDGAVTEVVPKEDEEETDAEKEARLAVEAEAAEKDNKNNKPEVKAEEVQQISVWTMNVLNTSFEVGDKVTREGWEEGTEESVGSGEFQLEDGRRVITDASGKIVVIKEAEVEKDIPVDAEASFESLLEKVTTKVSENVRTEIQAEFDLKLAEKDTEIEGLKKLSGKEIAAGQRDFPEASKKKENRAAQILNAANLN